MAACGSDGDNAGNGDAGTPGFVEGGNTVEVDGQVILEHDPLPQWCGPEGGKPAPPLPGGTIECPDDKNLEGCPCPEVGATAACWPGKRANRGLGACKDGVSTCKSEGELGRVWGPCEGAVLPKSGTAKDACTCFSNGQWKIDNVVPCFVMKDGVYYATSANCPADQSATPPPPTTPSAPWSANTLTVDCEGHFKLCYTIKGGDSANPQPTDCSLGTVCTEGDYVQKGVAQKMPDLPGWVSNDSTCVKTMMEGGPLYGEMTVIGQSVYCDAIERDGQAFVFNRIPYCKLGDTGCQTSGSGEF